MKKILITRCERLARVGKKCPFPTCPSHCYDVISQLRHSYAKGPFCVARLICLQLSVYANYFYDASVILSSCPCKNHAIWEKSDIPYVTKFNDILINYSVGHKNCTYKILIDSVASFEKYGHFYFRLVSFFRA